MSAPLDQIKRGLIATKLVWGLIAVMLAGYWFSPESGDGNIFLSLSNLTDVLRQVSITGVVAVGMTLVILTGGIDLSVGSVMALSATLTAMLLTAEGGARAANFGAAAAALVAAALFWLGSTFLSGRLRSHSILFLAARLIVGTALAAAAGWMALALLSAHPGVAVTAVAVLSVGLVAGAISGVIVAKGGLQPFIVTLAMMVAALGTARVLAGEDQSVYPIYPGQNAPATIDALRQSWLGLPVPGLIFLVVGAVFALLLTRFRFGRHVYAIGGNERAAHLAGIDVARVKILVYAIAGGLAALGGLLYAAQYRQGKPDAGTGLELDAIAAVVIGGASLAGGRGTVIGTLIGVLIFGFITNIFQLCDVNSSIQLILKGAIIVVAVLLQEGRIEPRRAWLRRKS